MPYKELLSLVAVALTFLAYGPYIWSVLAGRTKPHVFSWIIWGSATFIVAMAQFAGGGGVGAWPLTVSGVITFVVAALAYWKKGDTEITRSDWIFFVSAMAALPLWAFTADPLWAVLLLTTVDLFGFAPTFRKAYVRPYEEQLLFFALMAVRNFVSLAALETLSTTTVLFPALTGAACVVFIAMVLWRRRATVPEPT